MTSTKTTTTKQAPRTKRPTPIQVIETVSHPSRWMLLKALEKPMTAQELTLVVDLSVPNIIYHMRFLVAAGVAKITQDPEYKSRQVYHRKGFLAEIVVDYDKPGEIEVAFTRVAVARKKEA